MRVIVKAALQRLVQKEFTQALIFLLLLLGVIFFPVVFGDRTLLFSAGNNPSIMPLGSFAFDAVVSQRGNEFFRSCDVGASAWVFDPWYKLIHNSYLKEHVLPLWFSYVGFGAPGLANMQLQPFYPLLPIAWINPTPWTVDLFVLSRLLLSGLFMFAYLRLFFTRLPSIFGAIGFMLSGYFIIYLCMNELSVAVLLPALFYCLELMVRKNNIKSFILLSLCTTLAFLGEWPEVTFLVLAFGGIYFLSRTLSTHTHSTHLLLRYFTASLLGICLAAPQLLPFIEYEQISFNNHDPRVVTSCVGAHYDQNPTAFFLTHLVPLIMGPMRPMMNYSSFWGFSGYWGITLSLLAILASSVCLANIFQKTQESGSNTIFFSKFFFVAFSFLVLKQVGCPIVNWIGYLPLCNLVVFTKYVEPLTAFALSCLAAYGISMLMQNRIRHTQTSLAFALLMSAYVILCVMCKADSYRPHDEFVLFKWLSVYSALYMTVLYIMLIAAVRKPTWSSFIARTLLILLCAELSLNFLIPSYYYFDKVCSKNDNPYIGAPYIDFLHSKINAFQRICGFGGMLYPDWSSAFQLCDIRMLDAMYPKRFLPFIRNFVLSTPRLQAQYSDCLIDRFTGMEQALFDTSPIESSITNPLNRLWTLGSVKYLICPRNAYPPFQNAAVINEILQQNSRTNTDLSYQPYSSRFTIGSDSRVVLYQHPKPGGAAPNAVQYKVTVNPSTPILYFAIGLHPKCYDPKKGDGVEFNIKLKDPKSAIHTIYSNYIDPKSNASQRKWLPEHIDLSEYAGREITLIFSTGSGPKGDNSYDSAGWGSMCWLKKSSGCNDVKPIYLHDAMIFEVPDVLPRASFFCHADIVQDGKQALAKLRDPGFDVRSSITLESSLCSPSERAVLQEVCRTQPRSVSGQVIENYSQGSVRIRAVADRPGILMLNDTNFPGWKVYVDGHSANVLPVDFIFRGVALAPGVHLVEFKYEPVSFKLGVLLFVLSLTALVGFSIFCRKKSLRVSKALTG